MGAVGVVAGSDVVWVGPDGGAAAPDGFFAAPDGVFEKSGGGGVLNWEGMTGKWILRRFFQKEAGGEGSPEHWPRVEFRFNPTESGAA